MEDITNNLINIGKPLKEQTFDLRLTYSELVALKALAQNPHPNYWESRPVFEELFEDLKTIAGTAQAREVRRLEREERSNRVKRYIRKDPFD